METLPPPAKEPQSAKRFLLETVAMAAVAGIIVWIVNAFLLTSFYIPSGSMEKTLNIGDRVLTWKAYSLTGGIQRGDIVVFQDPGGWLPDDADGQEHLIKRVIGLPGDRVACCNAAGQITINGQGVKETFLSKGTKPSEIPFTVTVPAGKLWVMGDNRSNSSDSRYQTPEFVPISKVTGIAFVKFWPNITWLNTYHAIYYPGQ